MTPDATYKRIFAHQFMVEELMRWFVADLHGARELVDALDFSEMLRLHEQSVAESAEGPRRYADDMVWRVRFRGRPEDEGDDAWLHLVILLEFQSEVDFLMPLRIRNYVDNFHMEQWRGKYFGAASRLPPVLPIVIYNGVPPWSAAPRAIDLVTPGATTTESGSSNIASRANPLFSGDGYLLLDTHRLAADDLRMDNAAALLAGLERPYMDRLGLQVPALYRRLQAPELAPLRELMLLWARQVTRRWLNVDLGIEDMAEMERLHESDEMEAFIAAHLLAEQEKYRAEGRVEGRAEGVVAERNLLRSLVEHKFDAATADRLADLLARIDDLDRLAEVGPLVIDCVASGELLARVGGIADAAEA